VKTNDYFSRSSIEQALNEPPPTAGHPENLQGALQQADIQLAPGIVAQLDSFRELLWQANRDLNLTRHSTMEKFVSRDVFDSLELAKLLETKERVLDVGTGGGVPGIILTICRPDLKVSVSESVQKKATVLNAIVTDLALPVQVFASRAEEALELQTFDTLVARAVAPMAKMLRWFEPHWDAFDRLLLIKGRRWVEERGEARHLGHLRKLQLRKAATYLTPNTNAESVILSIKPKGR